MEEKQLLKKAGLYTFIILLGLSIFWFLFSIQSSFGYSGTGTTQDLKSGSRLNGDLLAQPLNGSVTIYFGTQSTQGTGTTGYIGTNTTGLPKIKYSYLSDISTLDLIGFANVKIDGNIIPSAGSVSGKLDSVGGIGTNNTFNNPTLAGLGTITASIGANGLAISPAELSMVDGATVPLNTITGSVTNHTHTGSDGTTQVSHTDLTNKGTQTHPQIDAFIASKASASGLASLDANSLVVQNPASGTSTPGASKTVMSDGTGKILDGWLSNNVTKLGTPTTDNIAEGSTNKYYTDTRVNAAVGSLSVNTLSDVNINFNENDFVKIVGGQLVAGSSSATVAFSEVTGSASASQIPLISGILGSATASQIPLISGINGSATASQLPLVLKLYGTTTEQASGEYGQLYVQTILDSTFGTFGTLTTNSLVSYYKLEDLTDTFVSNNLINYGTTTFVAGKYGTCSTFNGTSQYLQTNVLSTATTNISMFGWVYIASASEARPFFNNGFDGGDTDGYALGVGNTQLDNPGNNLIGHLHGLIWMNFATAIGTGWHHVGMTNDGTTWRGYIDKVQCATTFVFTANAPTGNFTIGRNWVTSNLYYNNKIDDVVFYNKCLSGGEIIELYNNTGSLIPITKYLAKYKDPVNGNTVFEIFTSGTATIKTNYIYCNASTTVFGAGTNTAVTGTVTNYAGWFGGAVRATAFNVASTEKIKENIKPIKIKPDLLDAEGMAKNNYIANSKIAWITENGENYTTVINETGTSSVIVVDTATMEADYNNHIELAWASDLNQDTYTENIQKVYEKGFWQMFDAVTPKSWNPKDKPTLTRKGFVVEDMPDVVKGDDKQSIDPMALIAYISVVQQVLKADTIFALGTLKELLTTGTVTQQKIDYCNDRLDVLNP